MTWGDKMTKAEIDDIFGEFEIDEDYMIKTKDVVSLFVAQKEEEKKEATPPPPEPEPVPEEDEGDAKKKKRRRPPHRPQNLSQCLKKTKETPRRRKRRRRRQQSKRYFKMSRILKASIETAVFGVTTTLSNIFPQNGNSKLEIVNISFAGLS